MGKYIKDYILSAEEFVNEKMNGTSRAEVEKFLREFEKKIEYFQHERLIHLLVTLFFALFELMEIYAVFSIPDVLSSLVFVLLTVILLGLLIGYVFHYYLLENSVQKMYRIRDKVVDYLDTID